MSIEREKMKVRGKLVSRQLNLRGKGSEDLWVSGFSVEEVQKIFGGAFPIKERGSQGEELLHIRRNVGDPLPIHQVDPKEKAKFEKFLEKLEEEMLKAAA